MVPGCIFFISYSLVWLFLTIYSSALFEFTNVKISSQKSVIPHLYLMNVMFNSHCKKSFKVFRTSPLKRRNKSPAIIKRRLPSPKKSPREIRPKPGSSLQEGSKLGSFCNIWLSITFRCMCWTTLSHFSRLHMYHRDWQPYTIIFY